jgi:hypothetical protein
MRPARSTERRLAIAALLGQRAEHVDGIRGRQQLHARLEFRARLVPVTQLPVCEPLLQVVIEEVVVASDRVGVATGRIGVTPLV